MHSFGKKLLKFLGFILIFALVSVGIFLFVFNKMTTNKYVEFDKLFETTVTTINKTNNSIDPVSDINSIDSTFKRQLEESRDVLISERSKLKTKNIPSKYKDLYSILIKGLDSNISLYKEILLIPSVKTSGKLQDSLENINNYANECYATYDKTLTSEFKVKFPQNTFELISEVQKYIISRKSLLDKQMLENSMKEKYIMELQSVYSRFLAFYQNRNKSLALITAQEENTYDSLIESLDKESEDVNSLLKQIVPIIPAPDTKDITTNLKDLIYNYVIYLQFFKHAVNYEMNAEIIDGDVKEQIDGLYILADKKLDECETSYSGFETLFQELKKSIK